MAQIIHMDCWDSLDPKILKPLDPELLLRPIIEPPTIPIYIPQKEPNGKEN